jgi:RNA polymerase sigma-70 factor (ECF subfamily)
MTLAQGRESLFTSICAESAEKRTFRLTNMSDSLGSITALLSRVRAGDKIVEAQLMELTYAELRRVATRVMGKERRDHTLQPTALVHEAYLRLMTNSPDSYANRRHYFAVAAKAMRRVLVDYSRRRSSEKRGASTRRVALDEVDSSALRSDFPEDILVIDAALEKLAQVHSRAAEIIELRFFLGLTDDEVANWLNPRLSG